MRSRPPRARRAVAAYLVFAAALGLALAAGGARVLSALHGGGPLVVAVSIAAAAAWIAAALLGALAVTGRRRALAAAIASAVLPYGVGIAASLILLRHAVASAGAPLADAATAERLFAEGASAAITVLDLGALASGLAALPVGAVALLTSAAPGGLRQTRRTLIGALLACAIAGAAAAEYAGTKRAIAVEEALVRAASLRFTARPDLELCRARGLRSLERAPAFLVPATGRLLFDATNGQRAPVDVADGSSPVRLLGSTTLLAVDRRVSFGDLLKALGPALEHGQRFQLVTATGPGAAGASSLAEILVEIHPTAPVRLPGDTALYAVVLADGVTVRLVSAGDEAEIPLGDDDDATARRSAVLRDVRGARPRPSPIILVSRADEPMARVVSLVEALGGAAPADDLGAIVLTPDGPSLRAELASTSCSCRRTDPLELPPLPLVTMHFVPGEGAPANVRAVVESMQFGIRRCYRRGLVDDFQMAGTLHITADVGADGGVRGATVTAREGLSPAVSECARAHVLSAPFAPPPRGTASIAIEAQLTSKR